MDQRYRDPDWLEEQYQEKGLTQKEIGEMCGVSASAIRKWMKKFDIPTRDLVGEDHPLFGKKRDETVKEQISETLMGREFSEETRKRMAEGQRGSSIPEDIRKKISDSLSGIPKSQETRRRMSEARLGQDVDDWGPKRWEEVAYGSGWKQAREEVVERDKVCKHCGTGPSELLHVHHIVPLRMFRHSERLTFVDAHEGGNLILLCRSCHIRAEWGDLVIDPDYESLPEENRNAYRALLKALRENPPRAFDQDNSEQNDG